MYERTITIGTLSKAYGRAGLRVGWCLAAPGLLKQFVHLRDYTTLYLSPLVELIAERAIEHADTILQLRLQQARENLNILTQWIEQHHDAIDWVRPRGSSLHEDEEAQQALNKLIHATDSVLTSVVLQPGDCCFIDNYWTVHGREPFKVRYDGTDRWLKRINLTSDLRKSRGARVTGDSRIIF